MEATMTSHKATAQGIFGSATRGADPLQCPGIQSSYGHRLWALRCQLGLTQSQFAERYGLTLGNVRDTEQGRVAPLPVMKLLIATIEADPDLVAGAAATVRQQSGARILSGTQCE
jgi:DNA-binding transcriptional regulator YiaG